jgi:mannose-6-phosphate isomerase-like protein (cupin superfamily)
MKHFKTGASRRSFHLLHTTREGQAAMMTLRPGGASDDEPSNEHPRSEQWLFVIAGTGQALVGQQRTSLRQIRLAEGSLLVIKKGELHQIKNTGRHLLRTLNVYMPPAYDANGEPQ